MKRFTSLDDQDAYNDHTCDSYCNSYCEACDIDYCGDEGHECILDEFDDLDEEDLGIEV